MLASFGPWPLRDGEVALGVQTRGGLPPEKGEVILGPLAWDGLPLAPHERSDANGCWTGRKPPLSQQDPCPHGDEKHSEANLKGSQALGLSVRVRWLWACKPGACSRQRRVR